MGQQASKNSCIGCTDRYVGCHSECLKYAEYRKEIDKVRAVRVREVERDNKITRYNRLRPKKTHRRKS